LHALNWIVFLSRSSDNAVVFVIDYACTNMIDTINPVFDKFFKLTLGLGVTTIINGNFYIGAGFLNSSL